MNDNKEHLDYYVGQTAEFSKTVTESDVYLFAGVCGDFNPVHINVIEAEKSVFGGRIVHGALITSFISTVLGMYLPGPGTIYKKQESNFVRPVYIGDTITARVRIIDIDNKKNAVLETIVINQNNLIVVEGTAVVKLPRKIS